MPPQNTNVENQKLENGQIEDERLDIIYGHVLAHPPPGEEVCISGLAGAYPNSDNVYKFRDNLLNKQDLVTGDGTRWETNHPEIPKRIGKINHVTKFDPGFFGMHYRQANMIDPTVRMLLEKCVEAILDAGMHPKDLEGTNTGVYVGCCFSETERSWFYDKLEKETMAATGCLRSMTAHRVSYFLKLRGPSYVIDTACSSSLFALENAYRDIRIGKCEQAIVAGVALLLHPFVSLQFSRLGVLSTDGSCKSFDKDANGYARSEAVCAILLQKSKDCKRIYAQIVHAKTNCDGYKEKGITYPSGPDQQRLLEEFYQECGVDPATLNFVEAHGTGTKVGDPEEVGSLDSVFCKGRKKPLLIGSVKSNIGHSEPVSGLCSITKVLIGMESGYIPPNINFSEPRDEAIIEGRIKVLTEKVPWQDDNGLAGVNSFGFGGANCHVLLRWNPKKKINGSEPSDDLPRLICVSGRVEEAISSILDDVVNRKLDADHVYLIHNAFKKNLVGHKYRGYSIASRNGELARSSKHHSEISTIVYVVFDGVTTGWATLARDLFVLPIFAATIQKVHDILITKGVNITEVFMNSKDKQNILTDLLLHATVQFAIADILNLLNVSPNVVVGISVGAFAEAYFQGHLSLEKAVLCVYQLGYVLNESFKKDAVVTGDRTRFIQCVKGVAAKLLHQLNNVICAPDKRNRKIVNGNIAENVSGEYFLSCLINSVDSLMVPYGTVVLKVGTDVYKINSLKSTVFDFKPTSSKNGLLYLLETLGSLYEYGQAMDLEQLYPEVQLPVSRGTPMISPLIKWLHDDDWFVAFYNPDISDKNGERIIAVNVKEMPFITGHVIDGRNLFPATGYLQLVWETLAMMTSVLMTEMQVIFENVRFLRASTCTKDSTTEFVVMIQRGSGEFEIIESGTPIVTGRIYVPTEAEYEAEVLDLPISDGSHSKKYLPLKEKDIYKELRLRGYNYKDKFRGLKECDNSAQRGFVEWDGNWVTFMDSMLQLQILQVDTRNLYVPTSIKRVTIDAKAHIEFTKQFGENPLVPVYANRDARIIKSGGIQVIQLDASGITRRKPLGEPVLEKYVFVPNIAPLTVEESIRVNMQVALENSYAIKIKALELIDEESPEDAQPIGPIVHQVLGDQPLIQAEVIVLTQRQMECPEVKVENKKLTAETDALLVILNNVFGRTQILQDVFQVLKPNGFVISRESLSFNPDEVDLSGLEVLTIHTLETEKIVFLKKIAEYKKPTALKITNDEYAKWLPTLQSALKSNKKLAIYSENEGLSGIIGFIKHGFYNCVKREVGSENVKCFFIDDKEAPEFDVDHEFYQKQLTKDLSVNVLKDGQWGTYRHLLINANNFIECEHAFANTTVKGDLSTMSWLEAPLKLDSKIKEELKLITIYYSALNFRDVMTASGRISNDVITMNRLQQDCVQGFEFVGRDQDGYRVMGTFNREALATLIATSTTFRIPDRYTFEEAATVQVVYLTVLYALIGRTSIKSGDSILIHAGTGGIGHAAITYCLTIGCTVFTTVGTEEKREYIKKTFPQIKESHIGNSRDTSFEQMVQRETDGRGVDFVLNSLAEEKLLASVRCLAQGGHFIEIGKFDLAADNPIGTLLFAKQCSFHGVMLDNLIECNPKELQRLMDIILDGIQREIFKPLPTHVFEFDEVEQAFRFMGAGKHMGKVLVKIRDEETDKLVIPERKLVKAVPRFLCDVEHTYIIAGGLGGFGLELADWLIIRGARKLILTSRSGVKNGYQAFRLRLWKSYGVEVRISTEDISTKEGCKKLLEDAEKFGPVHSIFNLAVVLRDNILENQTVDNYTESFKPKAVATAYFDELSRTLCPELRDFVIFSSVSCGRGNAGQTNYGMANSIMERICEKRKAEGLPAVAIEWGAVGDVGLVADMAEAHLDMEIGGTLQQRISSCLGVMDICLRQNEPVVSSMVVAEKRSSGGGDDLVKCVANILGLRDLKTVSLHSTLAELGMDSMMGVEIKQTLEREFEVFLTPQDIRSLTFARLQEIKLERENRNSEMPASIDDIPEAAQLLIRFMGDERMATTPIVRLPSLIEEGAEGPKVFLMPGLEGMCVMMEPLAANLRAHAICLQYCYETHSGTSDEMSRALFHQMQTCLSKDTPYLLVSYSYGSFLGLELVNLLEQNGYVGKVIFIDGSPSMFKKLMVSAIPDLDNENIFQTEILCGLMSLFLAIDIVLKYRSLFLECKSYEERVEVMLNATPPDVQLPFSREHEIDSAIGLYVRLKNLKDYEPASTKLKTPVKLFKPDRPTVREIADDYEWSNNAESVEVQVFKGNHLTILENKEMAEVINQMLEEDTTSSFVKKTVVEGPVPLVQQIGIKNI